MRISVYGAGVLGGNLANNLFRAKQDVTLLARGKWAEEIKQKGLCIKKKFRFGTTVSRTSVITELHPNDVFDVTFVVMRYTQLDSVLEPLCASDHAMNAIDEMGALNRDIKRLFDETGAQYDTWKALEDGEKKYLQ